MEIELCGYNVLIDDDDYVRVSAIKWYISSYHLKKNLVYFHKTIKQRTMSLHRYIAGLQYGNKNTVDHINGNTLDNRRSNLRICNNKENVRKRKINKNNTTGHKGVTYHKHKRLFCARIRVDNKRIFLGYFSTPELAHKAYCEASKKYHGEFGRTE